MSLESINRLSELTGLDRRTIKKRLAEMVPIQEGRSHLYESTDALPVLYGAAAGVDQYDLTEERARLAHHQANNESLKEEQLRGGLIPAELVIELGSGLVASAKVKILGIHSKVRSRYPSIEQDVIDEIQRIANESLEELGNDGLPAEIRERVRSHIRRLDSASESTDQRMG